MKKIHIIMLSIIFAVSIMCVFANTSGWKDQYGNSVSDEEVFKTMNKYFSDAAISTAKQMIPIYQKLSTCTPAESEYFKIYGLKNNKCHFKYVDYDCNVPQDVYKKYSEIGIQASKEMLKGNISNMSPEAKYMDSILKNEQYCSYNMTWEIEYE